MTHKITIKNLGPIKEIKDFEVKSVNTVIGESATGKSLLAKAIYAFNEPAFAEMLTQGISKAKGELLSNIQMLLGSYKNFDITYNYGNGYFIQVVLQGDIMRNEPITSFSKKLEKDVMEVKAEIEQIQTNAKIKNLQERLMRLKTGKTGKQVNYRLVKEAMVKEAMDDLDEISEDSVGLKDKFIKKDKFLKNLDILNIIFIPATRSFVSDFDDFRLEYLNRRPIYARNYKHRRFMSPGNDVTLTIFSNIYRSYMRNFDNLNHGLMRGNIKKIEDKPINFTVEKQALRMFEVSSGQKELFPILMILQGIEKRKEPCLIIIEEPEAHIFPKDQTMILCRIIEVAKKTKSKVFLTTHSPYILMAMNNLIEANTSDYEKLKKKNMHIDFNETNIQMLAKGKSKSILDKKNKLINMSYIEKIETDMIDEFQKILNSNGN